MPEAPVLEPPRPITPEPVAPSVEAPRVYANPLDNPKFAKLHPYKQDMLRTHVENAWKLPRYKKEEVPVYNGDLEKSRVLNEGQFAVRLALRSGEQVDPKTQARRLIFGVSPSDPSKIIIADDNNIVRHDTNFVNTGWKADESKIKDPIIIDEREGRVIIQKNGQPHYFPNEDMRSRGKIIIPVNENVSLGFSGYDPETHSITVYKVATDHTPSSWVNEAIENLYELAQKEPVAEVSKKRNAFAEWAKRNQKYLPWIPIITLSSAFPDNANIPPAPLGPPPSPPPIVEMDNRGTPPVSLPEEAPEASRGGEVIRPIPEFPIPPRSVPEMPPIARTVPSEPLELKGKAAPTARYDYTPRPDLAELLKPGSEKYISIRGLVETQIAEVANKQLEERAEKLRQAGGYLPEDDPGLLATIQRIKETEPEVYKKVVDDLTNSMRYAIEANNPPGTVDVQHPDRVTQPVFEGLAINPTDITAAIDMVKKGSSINPQQRPFSVTLDEQSS
ncbi:MAG: hypothetical protein HYT83_04035 [Candidatus Levybacteria bacterium]|nr:hypothetical protein [Candidatus Levybacteria bacterium]